MSAGVRQAQVCFFDLRFRGLPCLPCARTYKKPATDMYTLGSAMADSGDSFCHCTPVSVLALTLATFCPDKGTRFLLLGIASATAIVNTLSRFTPTNRMKALVNTIDTTNDLLLGAQSTCTIVDQLSLLSLQERLRSSETRRSEIYCAALELPLTSWMSYPRQVISLWLQIRDCLADVHDINLNIRRLAENDYRRKLNEEIDGTRRDRAALARTYQGLPGFV
ncbi:hypothetical protein C8F01DRAFT_1378758 [Mycena amicta]|nr:hypothetical protein C8F01DRAFT_1378758 [Mycena amicta]